MEPDAPKTAVSDRLTAAEQAKKRADAKLELMKAEAALKHYEVALRSLSVADAPQQGAIDNAGIAYARAFIAHARAADAYEALRIRRHRVHQVARLLLDALLHRCWPPDPLRHG